jgi:hypothetical protein
MISATIMGGICTVPMLSDTIRTAKKITAITALLVESCDLRPDTNEVKYLPCITVTLYLA